MRQRVLLAALMAITATACLGASVALASGAWSDSSWVDAVSNVGLLPAGYSVTVDESGVTTSGALGGSGSLAATGTGNVNYGYARECAPSSDGGPFSAGHYPPETCGEAGRAYSAGGSPEQPSGFWFTGNDHCTSAGRPFSGSEFIWHVTLPETGSWHVDVYVPNWTSYGWGNQYVLSADDGRFENTGFIQQAAHGSWVNAFGSHRFTAGHDYTVQLTPADTSDPYCHYQMADQMRWVYDGSPSPPAATVPVNTAPPTISGAAIEGLTLADLNGGWTNEPTAYTYQWEDCDSAGAHCTAIPGATSQFYVLTGSDVGHTVVVEETAANASGAGTPARSVATATVIQSSPVVPTPQCPSARAAIARHSPVATQASRRIGHRRSPRRRGHRRHAKRKLGHERVFALGQDEIAIAPGGSLATAYYHFEISAPQPFPHTAPNVHLDPVILDSRSRRVFLQFTTPEGCGVVLTGTFPPTRLKVAAKGKSFSLELTVPLTNLVTKVSSGSLTFDLSHGGVVGRRAAKVADSGGGTGGSGGVSMSLSSVLDVYANVLGAAGDSGKIAHATANLPAVERGAGDASPNGSQQPIGSTYKGPTADGRSISIEVADDKTTFKHIDLSHPAYPCSKPFASILESDESIDIAGWIAPTGVFAAFGEETLTFIDGELAGYTRVSVTGQILPSGTAAGVRVQQIDGSYTLMNYGTIGVAADAFCTYTAGFSASVAVTSGSG